MLVATLSGGVVISSARGFIWSEHNKLYLITNYHVVSGKNPSDGSTRDRKGRIPDAIRVFHNGMQIGQWRPRDYPLHEASGKPKWLSHPKGNIIDVVALPLELTQDTTAYPLNQMELTPMSLGVADTVSIVGYPRGASSSGLFPIWQTGYISSEPELNHDGLPGMLVDTPAMPGNSGSPVFAKRYGQYIAPSGTVSTQPGRAGVTEFVGVFSGSTGPARMRFVWKPRVILEIPASKK